MDLWYYIALVVIIVLLYILSVEYTGAFLYIGIIVFSAVGFIFSFASPAEIITGENVTYTFDAGKVIGEVKSNVTESPNGLQVIFTLLFIASLISAIILWSVDSREDEEY